MSLEELLLIVSSWFREKLARFVYGLLDFIWNWTTKRNFRTKVILNFAYAFNKALVESSDRMLHRIEQGEITDPKARDMIKKCYLSMFNIAQKLNSRIEQDWDRFFGSDTGRSD